MRRYLACAGWRSPSNRCTGRRDLVGELKLGKGLVVVEGIRPLQRLAMARFARSAGFLRQGSD